MKKYTRKIIFGILIVSWMIIIFLFSNQNGDLSASKSQKIVNMIIKIFVKDFDSYSSIRQKELLSKYHIGLFDVIKECEITNSSDSTIKNVIYNDIYNIVKENNIKHIFLNGKKAYELFQNNFSELLNIATYLPSTSSANASFSLEKLISYYSVILTYNNWW